MCQNKSYASMYVWIILICIVLAKHTLFSNFHLIFCPPRCFNTLCNKERSYFFNLNTAYIIRDFASACIFNCFRICMVAQMYHQNIFWVQYHVSTCFHNKLKVKYCLHFPVRQIIVHTSSICCFGGHLCNLVPRPCTGSQFPGYPVETGWATFCNVISKFYKLKTNFIYKKTQILSNTHVSIYLTQI